LYGASGSVEGDQFNISRGNQYEANG